MSPFRFVLAALPIALLASCGTPQQQCINAATKDLRTVEKLIKVVQGNIDRGYAYATSIRTIPQFVDCTPHPTQNNPDPEGQMCLVQSAQTFQVPVAIDIKAEERKLARLQARRKLLVKQSQSAIAVCQATYPKTTSSPIAAPAAAAPPPG